MRHQSFGMLKPDCIQRGLEEKAFSFVENQELRIIVIKKKLLTIEEVYRIYGRCSDKPFFGGLVSFMLSGPVVGYLVGGKDAIEQLNNIVGFTDPRLADPMSIRGALGESIRRNISHSSSDLSSFKCEATIFFPGLE